LDSLRRRARRLKADLLAMYLACRHPRTPWYARVLAAAVVAYLVSPLDLIPDFIPVLGYVDDLILVPLGIALVVKLIPEDVMRECRERALVESIQPTSRVSRAGAAFIVAVWLVIAAVLALWVVELLRRAYQ
jgi:uncharacterized membrane protein YkvA (DUF1232 family)